MTKTATTGGTAVAVSESAATGAITRIAVSVATGAVTGIAATTTRTRSRLPVQRRRTGSWMTALVMVTTTTWRWW